ncbi:hypothetical protein SCALIN_C45_0110 [Candidatus Scalindua japonica]|uniref:Methanolan biosynthesis EpsI domain-containing protein n=1 Tax=Candidatus Scalindua japonica TaxID=1284222 RepID=A0A286U497_9BACT|nr:exosortase C-terminal domain/associated protein EpsI [Candidatus Scalindua japonica]GAX62952.1 hypothetical protein SCALIN_C45_0110 [Candidatus Scalindua japonica]
MKQSRFYIPLIILLLTFGSVIYLSGRSMPDVVDKRLANLPHTIETWKGDDFSLDQLVIDELDTDVSISRNYVDINDKHIVTLYIGYYGTKKGGRTAHNPNACYPSSGWRIMSDTGTTIADGHGAVNRMVVKRRGVSRIVYHWYQDGDKIIQSGIEQNINRFINKVRFNRNDGAFVRISIDGRTDGAEDVLIQFGRLIIPLIAENWPVEG